MPKHEITVQPRRGPYDAKLWTATCSCGKYSSGPATEKAARERGDQHVEMAD